jgi:hypothetical protein
LLNGKVAIITGANQGLGVEIAKHYIRAGTSLTNGTGIYTLRRIVPKDRGKTWGNDA